MMTAVEVLACRNRLRDADALLAQVRGAFIVAQDAAGGRLANEALKLVADLLRKLAVEEQRLTRG